MISIRQSLTSPWAATGWWLTAALLLARLLPMIAERGMFLDGTIYATLSRNMAIGEGDMWHPHFSFGGEAGYCEMPTLALWLELFAFRLLGDHFWVEKLYSALIGLATAGILAATWKLLFRENSKLATCAWLPVALWACLPSWSWMYDNNLLENPLGLFAAASVYCSLRAALACGRSCLPDGTLSEPHSGPVRQTGPTSSRLDLGRHRRRLSRGRRHEQRPGRTVSPSCSADDRLDASLATAAHRPPIERCRRSGRRRLHRALAAARRGRRLHVPLSPRAGGRQHGRQPRSRSFAAGTIRRAVGRRTTTRSSGGDCRGRRRLGSSRTRPGGVNVTSSHGERGPILFGLLTGVSASLPIALSARQSGHYAFPSYAFYVLGLAAWCAPAMAALAESVPAFDWHRRLRHASAGVIGLLIAATAAFAGRTHRDKDLLHDTLELGRQIPRRTIIAAAPELAHDYPLHSYLSRWDDLRVDVASNDYEYLVGCAPTLRPLPDSKPSRPISRSINSIAAFPAPRSPASRATPPHRSASPGPLGELYVGPSRLTSVGTRQAQKPDLLDRLCFFVMFRHLVSVFIVAGGPPQWSLRSDI